MTVALETTSLDILAPKRGISWVEHESQTPTNSTIALTTITGGRTTETPLLTDVLAVLDRWMVGRSRASVLTELAARNHFEAFADTAGRTTSSAPSSILQQLHKRMISAPAAPEGASVIAHAGLDAWESLAKFFHLANADVARIVGVSEQTYYAWLRKPAAVPRPATLQRLLRLRAIVGSLMAQLGSEGAFEWFASGSPSRLVLMGRGEEPSNAVLAEASKELRAAAVRRLDAGTPSRVLEYGEADLLKAERIDE